MSYTVKIFPFQEVQSSNHFRTLMKNFEKKTIITLYQNKGRPRDEFMCFTFYFVALKM